MPTNGRQRYCRPEHRVWHRLAMLLELQCPQCGAPLTRRDEDEPEQEPDPEPACREARRPRPARNTVAAWMEYVQLLEGDVAALRAEVEARG